MERRKFFSKAGAGLALGATTTLAAPAVHAGQPKIKWRMTSSFPKSLDTLYGAGETICNRVRELTDGNFDIRIFPAGEIVPGLQALDAVQQGTVETCHSCSYYYVGKDKTFAFGTTLPFGFNSRQLNAWVYYGGGQKLLDDFYSDYNVHYFLAGNTGVQMAGWYRNPINSVADIDGLKIRVAGIAGEVFAKLGAIPQQIAGSDVYPALEKGTIDAVEWVGPYDDAKLGFYKVAKNYYAPGWWEPGSSACTFVNKDEWAKLPKKYQTAYRLATAEANILMLASYDDKNPKALAQLLANGVQLKQYPNDVLKAAYKAAFEIYNEEAERNPAWAKIFTEWDRYRKAQTAWFSIAEGAMDRFMQTHR